MRKFPFEDPIENQVRQSAAAHLSDTTSDIAPLVDATTAGIGDIVADLMQAMPPPKELACRAGCMHCCVSREIHASPMEVLRIFDDLADCSEDSKARIRERAAAQTRDKDADHAAGRPLALHPCPLLEDDRCSVYDVRPLVCRGFNSFDADMCARHKAGDADAEIKGYALPNAVWMAAQRGLQRGSADRGMSGDLLDLARALHILFEDEDAARDWRQGGGRLDGAKSRMAD